MLVWTCLVSRRARRRVIKKKYTIHLRLRSIGLWDKLVCQKIVWCFGMNVFDGISTSEEEESHKYDWKGGGFSGRGRRKKSNRKTESDCFYSGSHKKWLVIVTAQVTRLQDFSPHTGHASSDAHLVLFFGGKKSLRTRISTTTTHNNLTMYYRFQINCTFLPKSEIFYMPDVKNLCSM
jgi:hypothetical protein